MNRPSDSQQELAVRSNPRAQNFTVFVGEHTAPKRVSALHDRANVLPQVVESYSTTKPYDAAGRCGNQLVVEIVRYPEPTV